VSASRPTRPITTEELIGGLIRSLTVIARQCEEFSSQVDSMLAQRAADPDLGRRAPIYDFAPIGSIAAQLRLLLAPGKGDNVLWRVCESVGLEVPALTVGASAAFRKPQWNQVVVEYSSMGAIPVGRHDLGGLQVLLPGLWDKSCLALVDPNHEGEILMSWGQLVKEVADKNAIHLDPTRPQAWDYLDAYHVGEVPTIPFMLYRLGLAVLDGGNDVLEQLGRAKVVSIATETLGGMTCYGMSATRTAKRPGAQKPARNEPCFCGSGKKFKLCCLG
jgi:hypothetical protein